MSYFYFRAFKFWNNFALKFTTTWVLEYINVWYPVSIIELSNVEIFYSNFRAFEFWNDLIWNSIISWRAFEFSIFLTLIFANPSIDLSFQITKCLISILKLSVIGEIVKYRMDIGLSQVILFLIFYIINVEISRDNLIQFNCDFNEIV